MAVTQSTGTQTTRLGCGRDIDEVWDGLDSAPTAHEQACPYCAEARANLAPLAAATHDLATADRENPLLRIPELVFAQIMTIARTEVRRGRTLPLQHLPTTADTPSTGAEDTEAADLMISEHAIATLVRRASDEVAGVEARRCRVTSVPPGQPTPENLGEGAIPAAVAIEVSLSVSPREPIPALVDAWRGHVMAAVQMTVGVRVARIDVMVEDILDAQ